MAFPTFYLLITVEALFIPLFSAVLTDWLSIIARLGSSSLPSLRLTSLTTAILILKTKEDKVLYVNKRTSV
ncbi:hypothetical protein MiTe_04504 [Microcystis aeruginosa NIES-2520]|jgi:hypothetical protein|uniref:Uncharacterized protein n=1 Tax=Microcystis aeruginosa NIES-2520 TaxID=2303982 RepID=A0A5A5RRJ7_MICAE|nr:hypothetical protein MiTe_04504 [Microcystis aeruginosa NIES-2520]